MDGVSCRNDFMQQRVQQSRQLRQQAQDILATTSSTDKMSSRSPTDGQAQLSQHSSRQKQQAFEWESEAALQMPLSQVRSLHSLHQSSGVSALLQVQEMDKQGGSHGEEAHACTDRTITNSDKQENSFADVYDVDGIDFEHQLEVDSFTESLLPLSPVSALQRSRHLRLEAARLLLSTE